MNYGAMLTFLCASNNISPFVCVRDLPGGAGSLTFMIILYFLLLRSSFRQGQQGVLESPSDHHQQAWDEWESKLKAG